jgi:hypothetical protein
MTEQYAVLLYAYEEGDEADLDVRVVEVVGPFATREAAEVFGHGQWEGGREWDIVTIRPPQVTP